MRKIVFRGKRFAIAEDHPVVKGHKIKFDMVMERGGAVVVPVLDDGRIVMERQYRHTIRKWGYELPGGLIERGETPREAAARELKEETGYTAKRLKFLFADYLFPGIGNHYQHVFLATGLAGGRRNLEDSEDIDVVIMTLDRALRLVDENMVEDATARGTLLYYAKHLGDL